MKIQAAVLVEQHKPLVFMELEAPALKEGQVLVKIAYTGICRTQINEIIGLKGPDPYLPHTLGHEGSGIVMECHGSVTKVKPGDTVVATWIKGKGLDAPKTVYTGSCNVNSGAISTFMDYAIIAENRLVPIPSNIPLHLAALFGCAIPTGAGIVHNDLQFNGSGSIAIFGVGGIGASALLAASCNCPHPIIAIDVEEGKLALAKHLGATHTINAKKENALEAISKITSGRGVDFAIEAAGHKTTMEAAFKSVRDQGGTCILAGNTPKGVSIESDPFDFIKGKRLIGSWGGGVQPDRDIPLFLTRFLKEDSKLESLISHTMPLFSINEACTLMQEGKAARILIDCNKV